MAKLVHRLEDNVFTINIINDNTQTSIYDDIKYLVLKYYCDIKLDKYNIKLEVINEIYNNKLDINKFTDKFIIDMYNYINGIEIYDNIKNYINDIFDINNDIITKKDLYVGNNFYDNLYNKILLVDLCVKKLADYNCIKKESNDYKIDTKCYLDIHPDKKKNNKEKKKYKLIFSEVKECINNYKQNNLNFNEKIYINKKIEEKKRLDEQKRLEEKERLDKQKKLDEQKRLDEQKSLDEQKRHIKNNIFDKQKRPIKNYIFDEINKPVNLNQQFDNFKINDYNKLILGKYNLSELIENLSYKKYTFDKNDNYKLKIFLDNLDYLSNDINEENRKKLIYLLLIFVTNFIDD
jgi:hypothetical protein